MRDADVRLVLRRRLDLKYGEASTIIVEELGLCSGSIRADMAVVNGSLKGYEIKSERDKLDRLLAQAEIYNRVFDTVTIVVANRHLKAAEAFIPAWWGIDLATALGNIDVAIDTVRDESSNPAIDPSALVQLLWRDEALNLLTSRAIRLPRKKSRQNVWDCLVANLSLTELRTEVRAALKSRTRWRVAGEQTPDGERSRLSATSSDSLCPLVLPRSRRYTYRPN
jgi:hypothetical protein